MFPEVLENSTTLTPWMEVVRGVLTSEKEDKGHGHAEEKYHDNNEETEHDHNHKSGDKHYRIVSGVLNTPSRCLDLICCVDNERTGTQASIWAHSTHKQVRTHWTCVYYLQTLWKCSFNLLIILLIHTNCSADCDFIPWNPARRAQGRFRGSEVCSGTYVHRSALTQLLLPLNYIRTHSLILHLFL